MAGKKRRATTGAGAKATAAPPKETTVQQHVLQHYAKTVYFNDLWVSFLSKMAGLVVLMAYISVQKMRFSPAGLQFIAGFEGLSLVIAFATVFFIRRFFNALLAFKIAFAFSLLQVFWYGVSYFSRYMEFDRQEGDLLPDQLPFGTLYFVVCWASDRFMVGTQNSAKEAAEEIQDVMKQKKA